MDRGRPLKGTPAAPGRSDGAANSRRRGAVVHQMRHKIELALAVADRGGGVGEGSSDGLVAAEAQQIDLDCKGHCALHAALAKYGDARGS